MKTGAEQTAGAGATRKDIGNKLITDYLKMIELEKTLDVAAVEKKLAELWSKSAGELDDGEVAVLRSRVANLLVFVSNASALQEAAESMQMLTAAHPGRVLLLLGDREAEDRDIEMSVTSICQTDKRTGAKHLCGEEVTLKAQGKFVVELPSAAIPLLVSDLCTFIYWRDAVDAGDEVLQKLLPATDRFVIDSLKFDEPLPELTQTNELCDQGQVGITDLNWERLTLWRALLADFYDVPAYQQALERIDSLTIDFVAPETDENVIAPQALLIVGWLASRLGWTMVSDQGDLNLITFTAADRNITVKFNRAQAGAGKPGRLVQVNLSTSEESPASFVVTRSADNSHILAEARIGSEAKRGRLLPVRNRSTAQLLAREMEILSLDRVYRDAVAMIARLING